VSEALLVFVVSLAVILAAAVVILWVAYRGALDALAMLLIEFTEDGEHELTEGDEKRYVASGYRGVQVERSTEGGMKVRLR
jgi:hypothetical protein